MLFFLMSMLVLSVVPTRLWAQGSSTPQKLAENDRFAVVLAKGIDCGKDAAIEIELKATTANLEDIHYQLTEDFGNKYQYNSDKPRFESLSADKYILSITGKYKASLQTYQSTLSFTIPIPPGLTDRDFAVFADLTRKSLLDAAKGRDLSTGTIALRLHGGKGIGSTTVTITSYTPQAGYTPTTLPALNVPLSFTPTSTPDVVQLDGSFPAGDYILNVFDGCLGVVLNAKLPGAELKALFPLELTFDFCGKNLKLKHINPWERASYLYWDTHKLEVGLGAKGQPITQWWSQTTADQKGKLQTLSLPDALLTAIEDAGGYQVALRYTDVPNDISVVKTDNFTRNIKVNDIVWRESDYLTQRNCNMWVGYAPWFYTEGTSCDQELVVTKKGTTEVVRTFNTVKPPAVPGWPYNTDLVATARINGKLIGTKEFRVNRSNPYIGFKPNLDVYRNRTIDVVIVAGNLGDECLPVVRVKDKNGVVIYHQRMPQRDTPIPGVRYNEEYTVDFFDNETSTTPIAETKTFSRTQPKEVYMYGWDIELCNHVMRPWIDWENGYYQGQTMKWPVGSVWTFEAIDVEASALPYKHTYQYSPTGFFYLPLGSYPPGKYKVTIDMDPTTTDDQLLVYELNFAGGYQKDKPLRVELSNECTDFSITPRDGTYTLPSYPGYKDNSSRSIVLERQHSNGSWTAVANLERDVTYHTTQQGHYRAVLGTCNDNIVEFDLKIPSPKLKFYSTFAYFCGAAAAQTPTQAGTILIEAESGTPPYSYHLYEYDSSKPQELGTHIQTISNKGIGQQVVFSGLPVKRYKIRVEDACNQYFFYEDAMRPFSEIARAFVEKSEVCVGEPIRLFTYQLEGMKFEWTKVGDPSFTHPQADERDLQIDKARLSDAGTYQLSVTDLNCDNGKPFTSTVTVRVVPPLAAAQLNSIRVEACWKEAIQASVVKTFDGKAPFTYQWEWSEDDGANWQTIPGQTTMHLNFVPPISEVKDVWVRCQVTDACGFVVHSPKTRGVISPCYSPINPQLMQKVQ